MCGYYLLELLGYLPGPSPQGHIAGWFIAFSQWLFFPEALLLWQVSVAWCWRLPPVQWEDALRLAERQLEAIMGVPRTRFRSARPGACGLWAVTCAFSRSVVKRPALLRAVRKWFGSLLVLWPH